MFPISRDPPEGGTVKYRYENERDSRISFQFLGIPPKGEPGPKSKGQSCPSGFQFLGIPPKGERIKPPTWKGTYQGFPISRDPPEGGTCAVSNKLLPLCMFPISRDPPEGGTTDIIFYDLETVVERFQFLGIPPKGERSYQFLPLWSRKNSFQFLGIPPKGELGVTIHIDSSL